MIILTLLLISLFFTCNRCLIISCLVGALVWSGIQLTFNSTFFKNYSYNESSYLCDQLEFYPDELHCKGAMVKIKEKLKGQNENIMDFYLVKITVKKST